MFGHQAAPPGLPDDVSYQQLVHPTGEALVRVVSVTHFLGKLQVVGEFSDGSRYIFYDGARVTDAAAPPYAVDSGTPTAMLTQNEKVYAASGPNLFYSAVRDSTDFGSGAGTGAGVIVMSTHAEGSETITALARYDEYTAVFSNRSIQTWYLDPDPALSRQAQVLNNTGAIAARSVTQFGDGDVFYLDRSGIRSLRARNSSNSAATTDIGSPIDPLVTSAVIDDPEAAERAVGIIEPRDGRFWMALGDRIFVFSYFSASKVSAWTEYRPGFPVEDMLVWDGRVWVRSGDKIYVYGGLGDRFTYSASTVAEAWLPYMDADAPFRDKVIRGVDAAVRGSWDVRIALDPTDQNASDLVARITRTTFGAERLEAAGVANHVSLRFRSSAPVDEFTPAVLSSAVVHFDRDREEDG